MNNIKTSFSVKKDRRVWSILVILILSLTYLTAAKAAEVTEEIEATGADALNLSQDMEKVYFNSDYEWMEDEQSVFQSLTWEELEVLLEQEGNYLILFGGAWCTNTTPVIGYINQVAKEYDVETIYTFDLRVDGATADSHIRESNGATRREEIISGSLYNYLYGELVTRYLKNLDEYVEYKISSSSALTYTDAQGKDVTVPKVQVPFLFLYNKDNKETDGTDAPIVSGLELMKTREDFLYIDESIDTEMIEDYKEILREKVFDAVKDIELSSFTEADYIREIYNQKSGKEIFQDTDQINIKTLTYRQMQWLLQQDGDYLILFGGSWSESTQAVISIINEYAVANNVTIYNFDTKLDGGYAKEYWGYTKDLDICDSTNEFANLYVDLANKYFPEIETKYNTSDTQTRIFYIDKNGQEIQTSALEVPYLFSYNKNTIDENGHDTSIAAYVQYNLDESSEQSILTDENYSDYMDGVFHVIETYAKNVGITANNIVSASTSQANSKSKKVDGISLLSDHLLNDRIIAAIIVVVIITVTLIVVRTQEKNKKQGTC